MALSNWDTLAFDTDGNPGNGDLVLPDGSGGSFYKNWIYLRNPKMWYEGCAFTKPTIASIHEGELTIGCMDIFSVRHEDQNSIFALIEARVRGEDGKLTNEHRYMCGIGCYGFMDELEYLEKNRPNLMTKLGEQAKTMIGDDWRDRIASTGTRICGGEKPKWIFNFDGSDEEIEFEMDHEPDLGDLWCGVKLQTLFAFRDWLKKIHIRYIARDYIDKVVQTIESDKALRFNQGDKYFAEAGAVIGAITSPIGQCTAPLMGEIIKRDKLRHG